MDLKGQEMHVQTSDSSAMFSHFQKMSALFGALVILSLIGTSNAGNETTEVVSDHHTSSSSESLASHPTAGVNNSSSSSNDHYQVSFEGAEVHASAEAEHGNHHEETAVEEEFISERELEEFIFVNYSRHRRPRKRAKDVVQVALGISIYNINDIIEKSHEMRTTCALKVRWHDEFLVWNESEKFSSIKSLAVEREEVWIPDVALVNSGDMYALMDAEGILASVRNDGQVEFLPMSTITSFCDLDLTYFPFDYQSCYLRFESWTYEPHQETFTLIDDPVNLENLKINEQWDVVSAESSLQPYCYTNKSTDSCYPGIEFTLFFKRKASYYNVNIIIPSLIIAIVEIVTFSLPTPEVMKVHISFTCLLAYAVFQTTINADMPRTSEHTPLMSVYIDLQMAFIGVALLGEGVVFICLGQAEHLRSLPPGLRKTCDLMAQIIFVDSSNADFEESALEKQEDRDEGGGAEAMNPGYGPNMAPFTSSNAGSGGGDSVLPSGYSKTPGGAGKPEDPFNNYFRVLEENKDRAEKVKKHANQHNRHDWLFIADVAERLTLITYVLCISITPLIIFYILPTRHSKMPIHHEH